MLIDVIAGLILTLKPFLILQNYEESKEKVSFSNGVFEWFCPAMIEF